MKELYGNKDSALFTPIFSCLAIPNAIGSSRLPRCTGTRLGSCHANHCIAKETLCSNCKMKAARRKGTRTYGSRHALVFGRSTGEGSRAIPVNRNLSARQGIDSSCLGFECGVWIRRETYSRFNPVFPVRAYFPDRKLSASFFIFPRLPVLF